MAEQEVSSGVLLRKAAEDKIFGQAYLTDEKVSTIALTFVSHTTTAMQALALTELIFPKLVRYRGGTFLEAHFDPENVDTWMSQPDATIRGTEAVVNHIHLAYDQFLDTPEEHMPVIRGFAEILAATWPDWARKAYGVEIDCEIYSAYDDDLEITFFTREP